MVLLTDFVIFYIFFRLLNQMDSKYLIILVTFCCIGVSIQDKAEATVEDDSNPISEAISSILKEQNGQNIGALVQNFLQDQGGNILGNVLANVGKQHAGKLLQGLGSVLANQGSSEKNGKVGHFICFETVISALNCR